MSLADKEWLTTGETARVLGIHATSVLDMVKLNKFPEVRRHGVRYYIHRDSVKQVADNRMKKGL